MKFGNLLFVLFWLCTGIHAVWAGDGRWSSNGPYGGSTIRLRIDPGNPFTMYTISVGGLFRTEDGGTSWTRIEHGIPNAVSGYAFALDEDAPSNLYVFDDAGLLYHSADRGDNWMPTGFRVPGPLIAYDLVDAPGISWVARPATTTDCSAMASRTAPRCDLPACSEGACCTGLAPDGSGSLVAAGMRV